MNRKEFLGLLTLIGCTDDMQLSQQAILMSSGLTPPPIPTSYPAMHAQKAQGDYARTSARQTTLEPGSGGIDSAMSWSGWFWINNYGSEDSFGRLFGVMETTTNAYQYVLQLVPYSFISTPSLNQCLGFVLQNAAQTANISCYTGAKIRRARWLHITITYDGSEVNTGIKIYLNGVEDTAAQRFSGGSYAGVGSSAGYRFSLSSQDNGVNQRIDSLYTDFAIWNRVLTAGEITSLYNNGIPFDITTLSYYGTAIRAFYPLHSDTTCTNNAGLNLTNTGCSFATYPLSPTYGSISCFNALPSNSRYLAFGSLFYAAGNLMAITRSGTSHLSNGKIIQALFNTTSFGVTGPTDIIPFGNDLRPGNAGVVGSNIQANIIEETNGVGTVLANTRFTSTDGLVGQTFDGGNAITVPFTNGGFYGKVIEDYVDGEYKSMFYALDGSTYRVYLATFAAGAWTFVQIHSSAAGDNRLVEPCLIKCGNNIYIVLGRSITADLYLMYSTDGGATWSSPAATGLATGVAMADGCITASGRLTVIWADRGTDDTVKYSPNNVVADLIADPTNWATEVFLFEGYATDSLGILGYPSIVADGYHAAICFSAEFSSSRADLIFGYGQIDPG